MSRIITIVLVGLATLLLARAGQIHLNVWKAGESRKDLLDHFVGHTKTLTERKVYEARFWSEYGDHSSATFTWYLMGGLCAGGVADLWDRWTRRAKNEKRASKA